MIKAILTDIEGTTSSIHFVKQVLFPYAARVMPDFVRAHADESTVRALLADVAQIAGIDERNFEQLIACLLQWIDEDRKLSPLKALQGLVWEAGYRQGDYQAHLYPDAYAALQRWYQQGYPLYVYSSGSVHAQKLFFRYSECGDVTGFFSGYFDTTTGPKRESESYRRIATAIGLPAENVLFLSDIREELDAARDAGMCTCWLVRSQDTTATETDIAVAIHQHADSFAKIHPEEISA